MTILVGIDYRQRMQYLKKLSFAVHKWHNLAEWYTYDQFCSIVYLLNIFNNHIITVFATNGIFLLPLETFFIGTEERMFSTSGWLLNQRRASMSDSTLDDIIFLKSYFERQKK